MRRNLFLLYVCIFLRGATVGATSVISIQDGDFFTPQTWENNQLPDLSVDSIIIEHHVSFGQNIHLTGSAYLNIKFCGYLCGNSSLFVGQNVSVYNQGEMFTGAIDTQGYFLNHGRVDCNGMHISGGSFSNIPLGYAIFHQAQQDCINRYLPETFFRIKNIADKKVVVYLKCDSEIDFGDNSGVVYASDSIVHSFASYDSFTVSITVFCPCDTEFIQEATLIEAAPSETKSDCNVFSVFPNPNNGQFRVLFENCVVQSTLLRVPFFNSTGQLVCYVNVNQGEETLVNELPEVESGIYYLAMPGISGIKPHKVIIIK